ncbi:uncharacterized protein [Dermacentor andersoni]|uniref:uncharacterized protein n=1 Tax=Dermacentor andersoni TaxID=34620 RepID=UPI003B3BAB9F
MASQRNKAREEKSGDYVKLLRLYGMTSTRDEQLATKIMKYEEELHGIIKNTTPPEAPVVSGTIRGMGQTTKPYVTPGMWSTMFSKYTNNTYNGNNTIVYQQYILDVLVKLIKLSAVGTEGLRHLIAWSMFRQLVRYTEPKFLLDKTSGSEACYSNVLQAMKLAVVSPFLQSRVKPEMVSEAERMMKNIMAAFRAALVSSTWLDGKARAITIRKLDKMKYYVGSPGRRLEPDFVEELYGDGFLHI